MSLSRRWLLSSSANSSLCCILFPRITFARPSLPLTKITTGTRISASLLLSASAPSPLFHCQCMSSSRRSVFSAASAEETASKLEENMAPITTRKKRVVSGVQPTGSVHLGNYLGAIKNWVSLQDTYETLFFIVDLHAITLPYDALELSKATRSTAAIYLACGVDTSKASVFVQSHVRAHVELMWLLSSVTPLGWLNRMIQFKEKSRKAVNNLCCSC